MTIELLIFSLAISNKFNVSIENIIQTEPQEAFVTCIVSSEVFYTATLDAAIARRCESLSRARRRCSSAMKDCVWEEKESDGESGLGGRKAACPSVEADIYWLAAIYFVVACAQSAMLRRSARQARVKV